MQQEINFYLLLPEKKKALLSLERMALAYGIFIFFLALHLIGALWGGHRQAAELRQTQASLEQVERRLAELHAQYPMLDPKDMESSLKNLQASLEQKNNFFNLLSTGRNFSTYLLGIAKAVVPELWLTTIRIVLSSQSVTLKGYALDSPAIQRFVNALAAQKEWPGLYFQLKEVKKTALNKEILYVFTISTQVESEISI